MAWTSWRAMIGLIMGLLAWTATPAFAKKDKCAAVKTQAECGKKTNCSWSGKACAAKGAATAKAGKKDKAAPAKATGAKKDKDKAKPADAKATGQSPAPAAKGGSEAAPSEDLPADNAAGDEDF